MFTNVQEYAIKSEFVSFDLLQVAIRSFQMTDILAHLLIKKDLMLKRSPMGKPIITGC